MKLVMAFLVAAVAPALAGDATRHDASGFAPSNPMDSLKLEALTETRDRPLFSPSRRPPAPAAPPPPPAPAIVEVVAPKDEPPPFDLVGVAVGAEDRFVLLAAHNSGVVSRVRVGEELEGWRVGAIDIRSVALEREGRTESVALAGSPPSAGATPAPAPPTAAEVAEQRVEDSLAPGPMRDEYKRIKRTLAAKR